MWRVDPKRLGNRSREFAEPDRERYQPSPGGRASDG
jgi:hypothetical protein